MSLTAAPSLVPDLRLSDAEVRFYQKEGYLVLPGFIPADVIESVREEVFDILDAQGISREQLRKASSQADKLRQCNQYLAGSLLDAMINSPSTVAIASRLIGGIASRYLPFTAVKAGGGGGTFDYHQDNNYTNHEPAMGSINIWVALVDMTPENGCLQVIPRSHLGGQIESEDAGDGHRKLKINEEELFPVRMRAGDAIAFTRWTVHGSGANSTGEARVAYALQYHRQDVKWLDKEVNQWKLLVDSPRFQTPPVAKLGK